MKQDQEEVTIKVLLFASAREAVGNISTLSLTLDSSTKQGDDDDITTSTFRKVMAEKYPKLSSLILDEESITLALNEVYVQSGQVQKLTNGDTIAIIPPISGG